MTSGVGQNLTLQLPHWISLDLPPRCQRKGPRRCLFGPTDADANAAAVDEAFEEQRRRMMERFGFDVLTEKPVRSSEECDSSENNPPSEEVVAHASSQKAPKKERRRSSGSAPYGNLRITDFLKARKFNSQRKTVPGTAEKTALISTIEPLSSV